MAIRIGILDFDSSHCVEFTRRINHTEIDRDQWVDGGRVVIGCPGKSLLSPERLPGFTEEMRQLGIPLVENPRDMLGQIDAVMIESVDGSVHWDRARPFIEAGVICFVDKPFTCNLLEARQMADCAERCRVPLFSSSALRYAPELVEFVAQAQRADSPTGTILGAMSYGPAPTRARNPGLFHYGIHATEVLFALLGAECEQVHCIREGGELESDELGVDVVTGRWRGGRLGTVRGLRSGHRAFGFVAFCEKAICHVTIDMRFAYRELLKRVMIFFETRIPPVAMNETLRIMEFIEAARTSANSSNQTIGFG
jgi:predicted dehydrogenase